jgi:hypothetical protein
MATKLNDRAYAHARDVVLAGCFVHDELSAWSEHEPSAADENRFLAEHGYEEYGLWFLGFDDAVEPGTKSRYKFPYGDFEKVHRCGLLAAEIRAAQRRHRDIQLAVAHLHGMIDAFSGAGSVRSR